MSDQSTAEGIIVPPYPGRTGELVTSLLSELRALRAALPADADLQAAEQAAQDCADRLASHAARQSSNEAAAPEGIIIPPYPGAAPPQTE